MSEFAAVLEEVMWSCHVNSINKGFWDYELDATGPDAYLAKMMLVTSEVSEIMEAYRKQHGPDAIEEEFADLFIRMVDLYAGMNRRGVVKRPLGYVIQEKMEKNKGRPAKHGNLI